ncbi:hypothetical protein [Nocardia heshunensis]
MLAQNPDWNSIGCVGAGALADVRAGAAVSMVNGDGKIAATGSIGDSNIYRGSGANQCRLKFSISDAPQGVTGAQVRVGQHPAAALGAELQLVAACHPRAVAVRVRTR